MRLTHLHLYHIEDDAGDRDLFERAVRKTGLQVKIEGALDGEQALEHLTLAPESNLPHLILLDLNLPKKDGRELLTELKRDERLKIIPVIVLTTSSSPIDLENCYSHGAACYLVKPIDFGTLSEMIRRMLEFWMSVHFAAHKSNHYRDRTDSLE
ncbi:MAG: response regulator [Verrucomicrobiota bacterium]|jgi:two-component system, chemotaxis family, response regulator Rcp1